MNIDYLKKQPSQRWQDQFGFDRDEMAEKVLRGGWFQPWGDKTTIKVDEDAGHINPYTLWISAVQEGEVRPKAGWPQFGITFAYENNRYDLRLRHVFFYGCQRKGLGAGLLTATMSTAIEIDCERVFVEPASEGSWYWLRRGALIQKWPTDRALLKSRMNDLAKSNVVSMECDEGDLCEIRDIIKSEDVAGLSGIAARDDLFVQKGDDSIPFLRHLLEDVSLGPCPFVFENEQTQDLLRKRVGVDIVAERAARGFHIPTVPVQQGAPTVQKVAILA